MLTLNVAIALVALSFAVRAVDTAGRILAAHRLEITVLDFFSNKIACVPFLLRATGYFIIAKCFLAATKPIISIAF
jgi:hypothetical protein